MIALSWSRLSTYRQCPYKFKSQYIDKDYPDDSDNPHFVRGKRIHKQLEDYVLCKTSDKVGLVPPNLSAEAQNAVKMIDNVIENYDMVVPERQLATNQDWNKCDWFAKPTVVKYRCIIDAMAIRGTEALVLDYKTGKVRPYDEDFGQLHISAAMVMSIVPTINKITSAYLFVDHKQTIKIDVTRDELPQLVEQFDKEHAQVNADKEFAATKNKYCHWCDIKDRCPAYGN